MTDFSEALNVNQVVQPGTEPLMMNGGAKPPARSTAAERMRLYRKRRRDGMRYVRVPLHVTDIDALIRMRLLKEEQRQDAEALQAAVLSLVYRACEEAT
jgi:hypothetical protein